MKMFLIIIHESNASVFEFSINAKLINWTIFVLLVLSLAIERMFVYSDGQQNKKDATVPLRSLEALEFFIVGSINKAK